MDIRDAYNSAREENLTRFKLRDQAINMYLAFIGTIIAGEIVILSKLFGFNAHGDGSIYTYLLPLIYVHILLCLSVIPFVHVYGHHDLIIGYIHHFIKYELLKKNSVDSSGKRRLVTWDNSRTLVKSSNSLKNFRGYGIYYLFTFPVIISYLIIAFSYHYVTVHVQSNDFLGYSDFYLILATLATIISFLYTSAKLRFLITTRKKLV